MLLDGDSVCAGELNEDVYDESDWSEEENFFVDIYDPAEPYPWMRWLEAWGGETLTRALEIYKLYADRGFDVRLRDTREVIG